MGKVGLIIIGHGSKLPHSRGNIENLAAILRQRSNFSNIEIAFMVRNTPTIPQAIDSITKKGDTTIILIPVFLSHGMHTIQEIPELIKIKDQEAQLTAKGIRIIYGDPLGSDERIADIIEEKAFHALNKETAPRPTTQEMNLPKTAKQIYETSLSLIRPEIRGALETAPKQHVPIIERVVHTTADPEFAKLLVISDGAITAGVAAIKAGAKIVTDVKMVKAGINENRVKKFGGKILNYLNDERASKIAHTELTTRAVAAMRLAVKDGVNGAVILIGNAPTAAFEIARTVQQNSAKPALIIATPVGYVGAAESKENISKLPIPYIIIKGRKGGSTIAVAIFNALLNMAEASLQKGD